MTAATFEIAPGLRLQIKGDRAAVDQYRREYGACEEVVDQTVRVVGSVGAASTDVEVAFAGIGRNAEAAPAGPVVMSRYKTVTWQVELGSPEGAPLRARIAVGGRPAGFARSLVQGYVIEPLLSVAAARSELVLLPAAGIVADDGLLVIIGRSRAGKSTIAARALAAGRRLLGDDQIVVDGEGRWRPFPRRMRFYPDLAATAPEAFARLAPRSRRLLRARGLVAAVSRGYVRPSLAVDPAELGATWRPEPLPAARIALIERRTDATRIHIEDADAERAVAWAREVLGEQRSKLAGIGGPGWVPALAATAEAEEAILRRAFARIPVTSLVVPAGWQAPDAIARTAHALGLASSVVMPLD